MRNTRHTALIMLITLSLFSLMCNFTPPATEERPTAENNDAAATLAILQSTQTALAGLPTPTEPGEQPDATPTQAPEPQAQPGAISGNLSYPSEGVPALRVVAFDTSGGSYFYTETEPNQMSYRLENLPPGAYHVVAYYQQMGLAGGYSQAVLCSLGAQCTDHSLIAVQVKPGEESRGADPADWYAPAGAFPPDPVASATSGDAPAPGSISGALSYPSESIPPLRVVAFNLSNNDFRWIDTTRDQNSYQIKNLAPGPYHVVAYFRDMGLAGGYTQAVLCGLGAACSDHSLVAVTVNPNEETRGVDLTDWYAPDGALPPNPAP